MSTKAIVLNYEHPFQGSPGYSIDWRPILCYRFETVCDRHSQDSPSCQQLLRHVPDMGRDAVLRWNEVYDFALIDFSLDRGRANATLRGNVARFDAAGHIADGADYTYKVSYAQGAYIPGSNFEGLGARLDEGFAPHDGGLWSPGPFDYDMRRTFPWNEANQARCGTENEGSRTQLTSGIMSDDRLDFRVHVEARLRTLLDRAGREILEIE